MLVTIKPADVAIRTVQFKGGTAGLLGDEYIEIVNRCGAPVAVDGWVVNDGDVGQDFTFPAGTTLAPGVPVRIYTNKVHPAWGGYSFNSMTGVWHDLGDTAEIRNKQGRAIARYAYGNAAL
ncbi:lamin tail domain-containing protein [Streptomyces monticola]|uniref:Lamin tail domain-containing protein n=1 Tax=Streptomyces monticola TaxID=2666263 RepID=A0ABW2JFT1_9ACTN